MVLQNRDIQVGDGPIDIAINNNTNTLYVLNQNSNNITVLDSFTYSAITTIPVGTNPSGITFNKLTNKIYVANTGNNSVSIIDTASNAVIKTIVLPVNSGPTDIIVNPISNRIYVANYTGNSISIIDGSTDTIISTLLVPVSSGSRQSKPQKLLIDSDQIIYAFEKSQSSIITCDDTSLPTALMSTTIYHQLQSAYIFDLYVYKNILYTILWSSVSPYKPVFANIDKKSLNQSTYNITGGAPTTYTTWVTVAGRISVGVGTITNIGSNNTVNIAIYQDNLYSYAITNTGQLFYSTTIDTNTPRDAVNIKDFGIGIKSISLNDEVISDRRLFLLNYSNKTLHIYYTLAVDTTPTPTPTITQTLTKTPTPTPTQCVYPNSIQNTDFKNVTNGKVDSWDFSATGSSFFPYFDDVPKLFSSTSKSIAQLDSSGWISQQFNTIAGQVYQISFKYSANGSPSPAKQSFSVGFGGNISTTDYTTTPTQGLALSSFDFSSPVGDIFSYDNDPYINNVSLLLRGNGTSVADTSNYKNVITNSANVQLNTSQRITGTQSLYFDGSNNQYLSFPYSEQFNFGSGDFTIEAWIKIEAYSTVAVTLFGQFLGISPSINTDGSLVLWNGSSYTTI